MRYSEKETYLYTFDYDGEHTRFGYGEDTSHYPFEGGIHHSNDNIYLFPYPEFATVLNTADTKMSEIMIDLWTSFAINGVPSSKDMPEWRPVNSQYCDEILNNHILIAIFVILGVIGPYMHINVPATMGENFYREFTVTATVESSASRIEFLSLLFVLILIGIVSQWN